MSPRTLPPYPKWIIAVLCFLTPFIGLFDLVFGGVALATLLQGDLAVTTGTITHSAVVQGVDSEGDANYTADVRYRFRVDGSAYEGTGVEFGDWNFSSNLRSLVEEDVLANPVGREVPVYYAPGNPAECGLEPGPDAFMVIPLMLLTPFNVALVVLWLAAINIFRRRRWLAAQWAHPDVTSAPAGTELLSDGTHIRLRAVNVSPLLAGLIGAGVTGFVCTFAGAALAIFADLSADALGGGYAVVLIVGAGLPWYLRRRHLESGVHDLVVDPAGRALAWDGGDPGGPNGRDFADITRVEVEKKVTHSRTSDGKSSTKTDFLVHLRDAKGAAETLFTFGNEPTKAECVAHWLRMVIGVRDV